MKKFFIILFGLILTLFLYVFFVQIIGLRGGLIYFLCSLPGVIAINLVTNLSDKKEDKE